MRYCKPLDLIACAIQKFQAGETDKAARLFAKAASHTESERAINIIEASNGDAWKKELEARAKAAKPVQAKAKKPMTASQKRVLAGDDADEMDDGEVVDDVTDEVIEEAPSEDDDSDLADLLGDDAADEAEDDLDADEGEEATFTENMDDDESEEEFAKVLATMRKRSR